ncbi:MAG TPA: hypothetical protein VFG05_09505 [Methylocella sp.]|nr:hypothetical protein [Methylocella sp.]
MKMQSWIFPLAAAGIAFALPGYAADRAKEGGPQAVTPQALTYPQQIIYRVSGVRDDGQKPELGVATSFHCTNWSNLPEKLAIAVYNFNGGLARARSFIVNSHHTFTVSTHRTKIFSEDAVLSPGVDIDQGYAQIHSTTTNIYCSAMIVDAASSAPAGIALHLVRFNPYPGSTQ